MKTESRLIVPMEESESKPRLDNNVCQYCGYASATKRYLEEHINTQHEMNTWYKCNICEYASVHKKSVSYHLGNSHKLGRAQYNDNISTVVDQQEVADLKKCFLNKGKLKKAPKSKNQKERDMIEESRLIVPIKESEFKPRLDKNVCQYCGYTNVKTSHLTEHINTRHEMKTWYKCNVCKYATVLKKNVQHHVRVKHKLDRDECNENVLTVADQQEVAELKQSRLNKRKLHVVAKPKNKKERDMNKESKLIVPMEESEFKPKLDNNVCQYCGYTSAIKNHLADHVNTQHEMKTWYKCKICKYATVYKKNAQYHVSVKHKLGKQGLNEILTVVDQQEVGKLKKYMLNKRKLKRVAKPNSIYFMPIEKSEFKPRVNVQMCQYCDYESQDSLNTDIHVNVNHELNVWYQCNICNFSSLTWLKLRKHSTILHEQLLTRYQISDLIIKDEEEIERLKRKKIEDVRVKMQLSKMLPRSDKSKFIPIDKADFKSNLNPKICQYCGFIGFRKKAIIKHVNCMHEMTMWYKCENCNYVTVHENSLRSHIKNKHSITINHDKDSLSKFMINDQEEIETLKRRRVTKKTSQAEKYPCAKQQIDELMPPIKDDIEIEEHSLEEDNDNTYGNCNEDIVGNLSDLDEEWLVGPSW